MTGATMCSEVPTRAIGALLFVHLSPMSDFHDQHQAGGLDSVDHAVVADA